ncbi:uncharacterized protein METZ01_LOCUS272403, partial [marine metagenome]
NKNQCVYSGLTKHCSPTIIPAFIKERLKQETDFDAISYLKIRAQEIGLNKSRVESLISKAKWRGYR